MHIYMIYIHIYHIYIHIYTYIIYHIYIYIYIVWYFGGMQKRITEIEITKHILQKSTHVTVTCARMVESAVYLLGGMNVTVKLELPESTVKQVGEICTYYIQYIHLD